MMRRSFKLAAMALAGIVALYLLAALAGSFIPSNRSWREAPNGTVIYLVSNGYHTGLILPASANGIDLSLTFRPTDLPDPGDAGQFLLFGWGDRDFYLETPSWQDLKPGTALVALVGSGSALLHVDHLRAAEDAPDLRPIRLNRAEYGQLVRAIKATLVPGPDGHPQGRPGYGTRDVFYEARGRYSLLRSCNGWTRDMLAAAGVKTALWTPFSGGVMHWFPAGR